jgi:hypothetical protein
VEFGMPKVRGLTKVGLPFQLLVTMVLLLARFNEAAWQTPVWPIEATFGTPKLFSAARRCLGAGGGFDDPARRRPFDRSYIGQRHN